MDAGKVPQTTYDHPQYGLVWLAEPTMMSYRRADGVKCYRWARAVRDMDGITLAWEITTEGEVRR